MKLIFIDIDGVLNSASGEGPYISDMEVEKLLFLSKIIKDTNTDGIVITSDRRYSQIDLADKKAAFEQYQIPVVGVLRNPNENDDFDDRGKQIVDYLSMCNEEIEKMVIIDDVDEGITNYFVENFVKINRFYGLCKNDYEKIKALLE